MEDTQDQRLIIGITINNIDLASGESIFVIVTKRHCYVYYVQWCKFGPSMLSTKSLQQHQKFIYPIISMLSELRLFFFPLEYIIHYSLILNRNAKSLINSDISTRK